MAQGGQPVEVLPLVVAVEESKEEEDGEKSEQDDGGGGGGGVRLGEEMRGGEGGQDE